MATIDAFQGAEKALIILATTTTQPGEFCRDGARLNVALTRGQCHLVVVGAGPALARASPLFRDLLSISQCKQTPALGAYCPGSSVLQLVARLREEQVWLACVCWSDGWGGWRVIAAIAWLPVGWKRLPCMLTGSG